MEEHTGIPAIDRIIEKILEEEKSIRTIKL